jgi:UDP-N-acetylglucosamine 1-carboxyvinyltransferase
VSAAKNAALPLLAASLLSAEPVVLENVPHLADVKTIRALLARLGTEIEERDGHLVARTPTLRSVEAPYELVSTMRASVLVLGPLLARAGRARGSAPRSRSPRATWRRAPPV